MKACQLFFVWKILEKEFFYSLSLLIELNLKTVQLERQSVEAWQNEKHYSKENNTSENPTPRQEIFKSVDHVKYEGQVRSGQVTTFVVCAVFSLSFQAVVLITKTTINHRYFSLV